MAPAYLSYSHHQYGLSCLPNRSNVINQWHIPNICSARVWFSKKTVGSKTEHRRRDGWFCRKAFSGVESTQGTVCIEGFRHCSMWLLLWQAEEEARKHEKRTIWFCLVWATLHYWQQWWWRIHSSVSSWGWIIQFILDCLLLLKLQIGCTSKDWMLGLVHLRIFWTEGILSSWSLSNWKLNKMPCWSGLILYNVSLEFKAVDF